MRARFVVAPPGGGKKSEVSSARSGGWLIRDFEYDEEGKRTKLRDEEITDEEVMDLLEQDPEFFRRLQRLAASF